MYEESVRKLEKRLREDARKQFQILHGIDPGEHALIERSNSGYRLNRHVRIVVT